MKQRKNIALFIGMLETEFSRNICEGALLAAQEIDANLFVLPGGLLDAEYVDKDFDIYRQQYNILYSYASLCSFDAIILEYGTITSALNDDKKMELLKQMGDVPVILLAGNVEGYSSICIDNKTGIQEAVTHLIKQHNCSKIGFVSGHKTNQDANERLQAYIETMQEHGLTVSEQWITYGNFTEYCDDVVEEFILQNPDIEAIIFANDQMALCGYNVMEKLHLTPKEDIRIIGFDDNPLAVLIEPHLTSVKTEPREIGYRAVLACPDVIAGREVHQNVKSRLVVRESCGCADLDVIEEAINSMMYERQDNFVQQLAAEMVDKYFNLYFDNMEKVRICETLETYLEYYFQLLQQDGTLHLDEKEFAKEYRKYMQACQHGYIDLKAFLTMDQVLYEYLRNQIKNEGDKLRLVEQIMLLRRELLSNLTTQKIVSLERSKIFEPILASTVSDMLCHSSNEQMKYRTIIEKLQKMGFFSSRILIYESGIEMSQDKKWEVPKCLYVKAGHDQNDLLFFEEEESAVNVTNMFISQGPPSNRRFDMMVIPLFANKVQYGFLLIESDVESFEYAIQLASQLSVSMEVIDILDKQSNIKKELEIHLKKIVENNQVLEKMSRLDPLTGILNRRGFLDNVRNIIGNKNNFGKKAIAIYADMDNLKIINDEFGHDEGDYSLKLIAKALSDSLRQSDVVARMGGDEFAAFAIVNQENFPQLIKERIFSTLAEMNEGNGKQYYVNMCVGIAEFVIDESSNVEHILTKADKNLYIEKKSKNKVVYKS